MAKIERLSTAEMAERMGKSRQEVALLVYRAVKRFRELIGHVGGVMESDSRTEPGRRVRGLLDRRIPPPRCPRSIAVLEPARRVAGATFRPQDRL